MDEKIKDQEVLLVKDQKGENLKAVTGTDEKGELKTVPPTAEHEQSFLKFDKHSNALENFLSNFMRQFKNPTPLNFFKVPFESAVASARVLTEMLKALDAPLKRGWTPPVSILRTMQGSRNSRSKALTPTR